MSSPIICWCFNYTEQEIKDDYRLNNGHSTILDRIVKEKKDGTCQCVDKNPKGR